MIALERTPPNIELVDAFARQLYRKARAAGPELDELATAIRSLHMALKHLRDETREPGSPLFQCDNDQNNEKSTVYSRRLVCLAEDSDFVLKKADTILEKYQENLGPSKDIVNSDAQRDPDPAEKVQELRLARDSLMSQKMKVDIFLETVLLHHPAKSRRTVDESEDQQLDLIIDKVNEYFSRSRLSPNSVAPMQEDTEEIWRKIKLELELKGVSADTVCKSQDILLAYIRDLQLHRMTGHRTPTLGQRLHESGTKLPMTDFDSSYLINGTSRPNNSISSLNNNEKRQSPTTKPSDSSYRPYRPPLSTLPLPAASDSLHTLAVSQASSASFQTDMSATSHEDQRGSSQPYGGDISDSMSSMHLSPLHNHPSSRSRESYLPPGAQPLLVPGTNKVFYRDQRSQSLLSAQLQELPQSYHSGVSPDAQYPPPYGDIPLFPSSSPGLRLVMPEPSNSVLRESKRSFFPVGGEYNSSVQGKNNPTISQNDEWTKVCRRKISTEVLDQEGYRYKVGRDHIYIFGRIPRDELQVLARKTHYLRLVARHRHHEGGERRDDSDRERQTRSKLESARDDDEGIFVVSGIESAGEDSDERRRRHERRRHRHGYHDEVHNMKREDDEDKNPRACRLSIVPSPESVDGDSGSPSSVTSPKPILKNKNPNHVRFDPDGPVEVPSTARSYERTREREGERYRGEENRPKREEERSRCEQDREKERDREQEECYRNRNRDRDKERDRKRDRERDRDRSSYRHYHHHRESDHDRDRDRERKRHRDREKDRERTREPEERTSNRLNTFREVVEAIGVSGTVATALSMIGEAAKHL